MIKCNNNVSWYNYYYCQKLPCFLAPKINFPAQWNFFFAYNNPVCQMWYLCALHTRGKLFTITLQGGCPYWQFAQEKFKETKWPAHSQVSTCVDNRSAPKVCVLSTDLCCVVFCLNLRLSLTLAIGSPVKKLHKSSI